MVEVDSEMDVARCNKFLGGGQDSRLAHIHNS